MKMSETHILALREIKRLVSFESFGATFTEDQRERIATAQRNGPFDDGTDAEVIREATRPYRDTWINPLLDALIRGDSASDIEYAFQIKQRSAIRAARTGANKS